MMIRINYHLQDGVIGNHYWKKPCLLFKIYPVLNHSVFEFVAYESVLCCVTGLVELARKLAHKSASVHEQLNIYF